MTTPLSRIRRTLLILPLALFGFGLFSPASAVEPEPEGRAFVDAENGQHYCACIDAVLNCETCR